MRNLDWYRIRTVAKHDLKQLMKSKDFLIPMGILIVIGTAIMVHMGWTGIIPMLLLNLGLTVLFLVVAPMLPKSDVNNRVPMAGSRFMPLEGEQVITGPRTKQAMRESSVPEGSPDRPLVSAT